VSRIRFSVDLAAAVDHDDGIQPRPGVALLKPAYVVDHRCGAGFDTAVITVDRRVLGDLGIGEAAGLLFGDERLDILVHRSLVAFQRQNIVGFLGTGIDSAIQRFVT
jgi:hypothetical protein